MGREVWALLVNFKSTAFKAALNQDRFRLLAASGSPHDPHGTLLLEVAISHIDARDYSRIDRHQDARAESVIPAGTETMIIHPHFLVSRVSVSIPLVCYLRQSMPVGFPCTSRTLCSSEP